MNLLQPHLVVHGELISSDLLLIIYSLLLCILMEYSLNPVQAWFIFLRFLLNVKWRPEEIFLGASTNVIRFSEFLFKLGNEVRIIS